MKCPYCSAKNTSTYYKAQMPNILASCPKSMLKQIKIFPFEAKLCTNCLLGFNAAKLGEEELKFIYDNYLYISPSRGIGHTKYIGMIETLKKYYAKKDKIVEIGCSEGYLLNKLKNEGYENLIGIEPGPQAAQAEQSGLTILRNYFNENTFRGELFDGFYLMHVFEHFSDPFSILETMKKQLSPLGKIIIEVPDFSGYCHQHIFYYNVPFLKRLCKDNGLKIIEKKIEMDALRVVVVHEDNNEYSGINHFKDSDEIINRASKEYVKFKQRKIRLNKLLKNNSGKEVYWWGAGSASVIYINQLEKNLIDNVDLIIVDGDKSKWDNYIPGINLKVNSFEILRGRFINCLIVASSFYNEIQVTLKENNISANNIEDLFAA